MANFLQQLDAKLAAGLAEWNIYTTILLCLLFAIFIYPIFFQPDPDVHPLLLARQSAPARIRYPGESAVFRSLDAPHSYPLRSGLNVRDPDKPKWQPGRDGDLRDIWKRAAAGPVDADGKKTGEKGSVSVVLGKQEVIKYDMDTLTREMNAIGKHLKQHEGKRVAIYLSNSVELIVSLFAASFYGITPILVPQRADLSSLSSVLQQAEADVLVVGAGAVPLTELIKLHASLKHVVWVVSRTSRHMDWHEVPEGAGGKVGVSVWHEIIEESGADAEVPQPEGTAPNLAIVARPQTKEKKDFEVVEYTQNNLVAAISAQISVLPRSYTSTLQHHLKPSDTLLSLAPLTDPYPLILTLAALYSNASLALTSVSSPSAMYASAFQGINPTILVALPTTLAKLCADNEPHVSGTISQYFHRRSLRSLREGWFPKSAYLSPVRLIYTYDNSFTSASPSKLTYSQLQDLRVFTGARLIYAHTAPSAVCGAVCQTHCCDYQDDPDVRADDPSHVGPPLSCLEVRLLSKEDASKPDEEDAKLQGTPKVGGPAVIGGEKVLEEELRVTRRNVFAYA